MTKLGVNVDHVATVRQARRAAEPDPVSAALLAESAGAHGITVHLRSDRRHVQERDIRVLREVVTTRLNVEMAATEEMTEIALAIRPDVVTLVPERPDEITTEGGLNIRTKTGPIAAIVRRLREEGIEVSLFIDPEQGQINAASEVEGEMVELNTAAYSEVSPRAVNENDPRFQSELNKLRAASRQAESLQLRVLAGHGLTYRNVAHVSAIDQVEELNIGHNIISRAVLVGMERAVSEMLSAMNSLRA